MESLNWKYQCHKFRGIISYFNLNISQFYKPIPWLHIKIYIQINNEIQSKRTYLHNKNAFLRSRC